MSGAGRLLSLGHRFRAKCFLFVARQTGPAKKVDGSKGEGIAGYRAYEVRSCDSKTGLSTTKCTAHKFILGHYVVFRLEYHSKYPADEQATRPEGD